MELEPPMEAGGGGEGGNTIWRLRHTDEGCSDSYSRKLCKCCQIFIPSNSVVTCIELESGHEEKSMCLNFAHVFFNHTVT